MNTVSQLSMRIRPGTWRAAKVSGLIVLSVGLLLLLHDSTHNKAASVIPARMHTPARYTVADGINMQIISKRREERLEIIRKEDLQTRTSRLPDAIGIGARKCGTGAFKRFLAQHPLIRIAESELHFYDEKPGSSLEYYKSLLPNGTKNELVMEKTPAYFVTAPVDLPIIMQRHNPKVKVILMLCDPVARAFSDWTMRFHRGSTTGTFEEHMRKYLPIVQNIFQNLTTRDDKEKVERALDELKMKSKLGVYAVGVYFYYLRRWIENFPPHRIQILNGDEFLRNPGRMIERVQEFLHIPKILREEDFVKNPETGMHCVRPWWKETYDFEAEFLTKSGWTKSLNCVGKARTKHKTAKNSLKRESADILRKFYGPYNEITYKILGQKFDW